MNYFRKAFLGLAAVLCMGSAQADINVGVILSLTGPGAALGIPERDTLVLWSKDVGGHKLNVTILDDASDPTAATLAARKLVTENKVDVLVGPSLTPAALAAMQVAGETKTPMIAIAGGGAIVNPLEGPRRWAFKLPPPEDIPLRMMFDTMKKNGQKRLGIVAMGNAYGQTFVDVAQKIAPEAGIEIVGVERFGGTDTSFVSQAIKMIANKPEAVLVVAAGTPAVMPQLELKRRGFDGTFFQTQAVAGNDYLRVGGKDVEGTLMPVSPFLVAEQLPDSNPTKASGMAYVKLYEDTYGPDTRSLFGGCAWDTFLLLEHAATQALKTAQPGTPEFKSALRDALEQTKDLVLTQGVYTMSETDHNGADERSQVMVTVKDGKWRYVN